MAEKADKIKTISRSKQPAATANPSFIHTKGEQSFFSTPSQSSFIQPKLQVSQPGDPMEKEADATADRVMRMSEPVVQPATATPPDDELQRKCDECDKEDKMHRKEDEDEVQAKLSVNSSGILVQRVEEKEEPVQTKIEEEEVQRKCETCEKEDTVHRSLLQRVTDEDKNEQKTSVHPKLTFLSRKDRGPPRTSPRFVSDLHNSSHGGRAMDNGTRSFMESRFNADFSQVKVHTDPTAVQLSSQISAQAFTHGNNIYFNSGKYNPATESGKHLLAHELTHTIQQGKSKSVQPFLSTGILRSTEESVTQTADEKEEPVLQRIAEEENETVQAKEEPGAQQVRPELRKAVAFAKSQVGKVNAQQKNSDGTRVGWERLKDYFEAAMGKDKIIPEGRVQTSGSILEKNIKYGGTVKAPPPNVVPTPPQEQWVTRDIMPSWCGIFTFWALNKGGVPMPKWTIGGSAVKQNAAYAPGYIPKPGDIAYFNKNSHYALVEKTEPEHPSPSERKKINVVTVNGNTSGEDNLGAQVQIKTHAIGHWDAFFNPLHGILDKLPPNPEEVSDAELQKIIGDAVAAAKSTVVTESKPAAVVPYVPPTTQNETATAPIAEVKDETVADPSAEPSPEATPVQEAIVETSPKTPQEDPAYQEIIGKTKAVKKQQKAHDTPESKANAAQMASKIPDEQHIGSQAKMHQAGDMSNQQAQPFNAQAFKDKLMERVKQALPKNDRETVDMYESSGASKKRMEEAKANAKGDVKAEKENAGNAISSKTKEDPATKSGQAEKKEVVEMKDEDAGRKPHIPNAEATAPKPKTEGEISMEKDAQQLDQQMAESNVTETQLANSNEPEFTGALKTKKDAQQEVRNAPAEYRAEEEPTIAKAEEQAKATVAGKMGDMHGVKADMFGQVDVSKKGTKGKDEEKRKQIATDMENIYSQTKTNVERILNQLEKEVTDDFDAAANAANEIFTKRVNSRLDDFYGITTVDDTISEYFSGLDPEINQIFTEEKERYIQNMDSAITTISNKVAKQLNDAMTEIKTGKTKIDDYWKNLKPDLQKIGEAAKTEVLGKFEELEKSVEDKHSALIEKLSDKYVQNVNKLQETFDKIKDSKKGWLSRAVDAVAGVIKAILRLKDMILETLAKVAHVVGQIIADPIGFLGQLVTAVKMGISNFVDNIAHHFKVGFFEWLLGNMPPGIQFPDKWDLPGIFHFVMQILGLTWVNIRSRAVKKLGEPVVAALEEVFEIFQIIRKEGLAGLWRYIKEKIGDIKRMVIDAIMDMLIKEVVKAGIKFILSLLNPVGAFIKACMAIYDIVMFFVNNAKKILDLINAIIDSVALIVAGSLDGAAKMVENALAKLIPITIGFLASLLGLGNISEKAQKIIQAIQSPINKAIDWVLDKAIALSKKLGLDRIVKKVKGGIQGAKDFAKKKIEQGKQKVSEIKGKLVEWWKAKKPVKVEGKSHTLLFEGKGENSKLMMRSTPVTYRQFINDVNLPATNKKQLSDLADEIDKKLAAYGRVKQEDRENWSNDLVAMMNRLAAMTEEYAMNEETDPHTVVTWGGVTSEAFGTSFNAKLLSSKYVSGQEAEKEEKAVYGWDIARGRKMFAESGRITSVYVKGHLLNANLGGKANATNLTPITITANNDHKDKVETHVKSIVVDQKKVANYEVLAMYDKHAARTGLKSKYEADNRELRELQSKIRKENDPDALIKIRNIDRGIENNINMILLLDYEENYLPTSFLCRWQKLIFDKPKNTWVPDPGTNEQVKNIPTPLPDAIEAYSPVVKQFQI